MADFSLGEFDGDLNDTGFRRPPKQERSRERVEEILAATRRLIGEKGIDSVKMREIGALAGGPISSVYQYFPNKSAILAMLFGQWTSEIEGMISQRVEQVTDIEGLNQAAGDLLDYYFKRVSSDPAILDLLNAIQADKALANLDIESTRRQVVTYCDRGCQFIAPDQQEAFRRVTFLMFQLANGAVRLAMSEVKGGEQQILDDYKMMIRSQLMVFARSG